MYKYILYRYREGDKEFRAREVRRDCRTVKHALFGASIKAMDSLKSTAEKLRGTVGVPRPEFWPPLPGSALPLWVPLTVGSPGGKN